jgi:hypothetical protein
MMKSKELAKLLGPTIVAVTISETINVHIWEANVAAGIHLNGALLFLGGISIIRIHNYWVRSWPVLITLTGWFIILLGLFRMFFPDMQLEGAKNTGGIVWETMPILVTGIFLCWKAYSRDIKKAVAKD